MTAPPVSELNVEGTSLALWHEWLAGFFDGASHAIGSNSAVVFPKAELRFQQSAGTQPIGAAGVDVVLTVVWLPSPNSRRLEWETVSGARQQMAYVKSAWIFYVRAAVTAATPGNTPGANAQKLCSDAAAHLAAILGNSKAARPLSQNGIQRLRPDDPRPVSEDAHYIVRTVRCRGTLRFAVLSQ